ncbi:MAG: PD40 domain-containing protein, partial [Saprospiraceae bacterium]|nr:PD40 domain-containing protein [Saprospiraceae bacterium]
MRKYILLLLSGTFFLAAQAVQAQPLEEWVRKGDKVFTQKDYYSAYRYYGIARLYDPERADILYQYAESARLFGIYVKAEEAYQKVIDMPGQTSYPLAKYHLARVKQTLGKYDDAISLYQQFLTENPNADNELQTISRKGLVDSEWAKGQARKEKEVGILSANVNSEYSEYGVAFKGDTMYYSSLKFVYDKDTTNPRRAYSKILQSIGDAPGTPLPENINIAGKHVGHTAFGEGYKKVYYTICDYVNAADVRCDIYASPVNPDGTWGPAEKLSLNAPGVNSTQPSIGRDGQSGRYRLYFASDRDGGKGKLDVWYSTFNDDGSLSSPVNLAEINTEGNDATPFFHETSQTLYFSTDGNLTLGGYDIYKARKDGSGWLVPENLGAPLNSSYNDLYYTLFQGGAKAYLSSNRPDTAAFYWDQTKETCCNDLYAITYDMSVRLIASTFNNLDQSPLPGTTVELYEVTEDGREILVGTLTNTESNNFEFPLERGKKYNLKGKKDGFAPTSTPIDLTDVPEGEVTIERKLYLEPPVQLDLLTFENIDSMALAGVTVQLFEQGPNGEERLVKSVTNPNSNDFIFMLERGKKYIIRGNKDGYASALDSIDLTVPEMKMTTKVERKLYLGQRLIARTIDAKTLKALEGATVELYDMSGAEPVLKGKKTNMTGNDFLFPLDLNKTYRIKVTRPGYNS